MKSPATTLCVDTSTDAVVVALTELASGDLLGAATRRECRAQALLDVVEEVLAAAGMAASQLDCLAVGTGPGAFTGLRIGVATMRGLAVTLGVPLAGVATLVAIAADRASLEPGLPVRAEVDARRGERFVQIVTAIEREDLVGELAYEVDGPPRAERVESGRVGAGADGNPVVHGPPSPASLARAARAATYGDARLVLPRYGRAPDATPRRDAGRGQPG